MNPFHDLLFSWIRENPITYLVVCLRLLLWGLGPFSKLVDEMFPDIEEDIE